MLRGNALGRPAVNWGTLSVLALRVSGPTSRVISTQSAVAFLASMKTLTPKRVASLRLNVLQLAQRRALGVTLLLISRLTHAWTTTVTAGVILRAAQVTVRLMDRSHLCQSPHVSTLLATVFATRSGLPTPTFPVTILLTAAVVVAAIPATVAAAVVVAAIPATVAAVVVAAIPATVAAVVVAAIPATVVVIASWVSSATAARSAVQRLLRLAGMLWLSSFRPSLRILGWRLAVLLRRPSIWANSGSTAFLFNLSVIRLR
jgi:hypothetical protein